MRTTWQSLAWKEWREHRWKLASILAIFWAATAFTLYRSHGESDALDLVLSVGVVGCVVPLSVFVGLGDAAGERSHNTLPFMQALPVSTRRLALTKLAFGLVTLISPILLTALFVYAWRAVSPWFGVDFKHLTVTMTPDHRSWLTSNRFVDTILSICFISISFYLWSASVGANRKDEVSAGAVALLAIVGYWLLFAALVKIGLMETAAQNAVALAIGPGGCLGLPQFVQYKPGAFLLGATAAILAHGALVAYYVRRFGRVAERENFSPRGAIAYGAQPMGAIGLPRQSPLSAIVWKQTRESGPLALAALAGIVGIVAVIALTDPKFYFSQLDEFAQLIAGVSMSAGMVIAMVVGIGTCFYDVGPQLSTFWRSRPINRDLWFWSKALTGLAIVLFIVYLPALVTLWAIDPNMGQIFQRPQTYLFPVGHLAFFAAAVAMTCLVRHAVYAAILSIPAALVGPAIFYFGFEFANRLGWQNPKDTNSWWANHDYELIVFYIGGLTASFVINMLIAWFAMRFDWGRKSRY